MGERKNHGLRERVLLSVVEPYPLPLRVPFQGLRRFAPQLLPKQLPPLRPFGTPFQGLRRFAPQLLPIRAQLPLWQGRS